MMHMGSKSTAVPAMLFKAGINKHTSSALQACVAGQRSVLWSGWGAQA